MILDLATVQHGVTALMNLALAVVTGAAVSILWLARGRSGWAAERLPRARGLALGAALAGLAASVAVLWVEAAAMAEVPLAAAGPAAVSMLSATHYGMAWLVGAGALAVAVALLAFVPRRHARVTAVATLGALAVFWYTRSMVSHAASQGDFSLPLIADWVHLALISLWVGECIIAGLVVLTPRGQMEGADRSDRAAYVASLSSSATFGLAGIFITGLFSAWHNLPSLMDLVGNPYGNTLLLKLAFVGAGALLGAFNRFVVMPPWLAQESAGEPVALQLPARFRLVLQVEAVVLFIALVLAVMLASTSPPGAAM